MGSRAGSWRHCKLGDFVTFKYGKGLPERTRKPGPVIVYGSNGPVSSHFEALVKGPGIIISRKGTVGAVHYCKDDFWPIDTTFYIKLDDPSVSRFAYYLLSSMGLEHMNADSAVPGLNRNAAHQRDIFLPPLPEQRRIAEILGALDDKIELNMRMNKTLEAMAAGIFKSWFIDFEPFQNGEFIDSELGPIPKGWEVVTFSRIVDINPRLTIDRVTPAPYVEMADLPTAGARVSNWCYREFTGSGSRFENSDVLLARITPCLENGKTAYIDFLKPGEAGWGSTEFIVLRAQPHVSSIWVYFLTRSDDFRAFAIQSMTGTSGRQRVQVTSFDHYDVVLPPPQIFAQFQKKVQPFFAAMKANDGESRTLAQIRDTLLPKLLSGKIRVGVNKHG